MNIEKWEIERIMQLPDWCFGTRYIVSCDVYTSPGNTVWDMSEGSFANVCVIWRVGIAWANQGVTADYIRIALGNVLPTAAGMMDGLDGLISGYGRQGKGPRQIGGYTNLGQEIITMRKVIEPQGRKLIVQATSTTSAILRARVFVEVSSLPKEVPDWLFSGMAGRQ